ncbi:MAG TPA: hypothetical protein VGV61_17935 [Thermoanaerobaculia bacterium]|jgi:Flp pilus assembly protein TadD|nr:hypothetical protein [Thermoanaerobaculia bacterium]
MRKKLAFAVVLLLAAALAAWAALRSHDKPEWTTRSPAALAEFRRGLDAERKYYGAEARGHYRRALALDPSFAAARVMVLRGLKPEDPLTKPTIARLAKTDRSKLTAREALLVDYQLDWERQQRGAAQARLERYLAAHPRDPYALQMQIEWLWQDRQWPRAEKTCQELLAIDPNWLTAQNYLGYLAMSQGHFAEAEDRFRTYRYVAPDQANPHDSLGELLALLGRWDDARRELEASLAVRPDFCASYYHLGQMALMRRDFATNGRELERARRQPACAGYELEAHTCGQRLWESYARHDWAALSQAFDSSCEQKTRSSFWMSHLGAVMAGDLARARAIEATVAKWNADAGPQGQALVAHLQGVRLVAEGDPRAAGERFAAVDGAVSYFGLDFGTFKLYNRLQWAHAAEQAGDAARARQLVAEVAAVNPTFAELYRRGEVVLPRPLAPVARAK